DFVDIVDCDFSGVELYLAPNLTLGGKIRFRSSARGTLSVARADQAGTLVPAWDARVQTIGNFAESTPAPNLTPLPVAAAALPPAARGAGGCCCGCDGSGSGTGTLDHGHQYNPPPITGGPLGPQGTTAAQPTVRVDRSSGTQVVVDNPSRSRYRVV